MTSPTHPRFATSTIVYREPTTVGEAVALLGETGDEACVLAGGTALMLDWQLGRVGCRYVLGLRRIDDLRGIVADGAGGLRLGALETHGRIERDAVIRAHQPAVSEVFGRVGTVRLRNQATLGGNLAQANPVFDPPLILMALDASVEVAGPRGRRELPVESLAVGYQRSSLARDEIITGIRIPPAVRSLRVAYEKFQPRTLADPATVTVAVAMSTGKDARIETVRVVLGAVAEIPVRAMAAESALHGRRATIELFDHAAALVRQEIEPRDDELGSAAYKLEMARVWTARALIRAALP